MTQKIVVKVPMKCSKCKSKAMKKAASARGVNSVAIDGDKVVVIGDEVDAVKLARSLKKKFGFATIESVEEVKKEDNKKEDKKEKKEEVQFTSSYVVNPHFPVHCYELPYCYDEPNPSFCSIL